MNHYSTVQEHGVQPELPPQHSSCESWLLISEWLSGTNISCPLYTHPPHPFPSTHPCFLVFYCLHLELLCSKSVVHGPPHAHMDAVDDSLCCHVFNNLCHGSLNAPGHRAGKQGRTRCRFEEGSQIVQKEPQIPNGANQSFPGSLSKQVKTTGNTLKS